MSEFIYPVYQDMYNEIGQMLKGPPLIPRTYIYRCICYESLLVMHLNMCLFCNKGSVRVFNSAEEHTRVLVLYYNGPIWDLLALHLSGTYCHTTGTRPPRCQLLENRLYIRSSGHDIRPSGFCIMGRCPSKCYPHQYNYFGYAHFPLRPKHR